MQNNPTGQQFHISHGRYGAVVTEVGATLRSLTLDGQEVLWTFAENEAPSGSMGRQLIPWPNRIRDGRYTFAGVTHQLPITEVPRHTALHGLDEGKPWSVVRHTDDEVVLTARYYPQRGWTSVLDATIGHRLTDDGLRVTVEVTNVGQASAPYGYGAHPYLAADVSTAELTLPFTKELLVDPERLLPIELADVTPEHDFRQARAIGDTQFDTALAGVDGPWELSVKTGGRTVTLWADATLPWGQVFTHPDRIALAVEPMTCGPDAFNEGPTHDGLIVLEPGASSRSEWGFRVS
ncbi:aldose 1-epimerase family protein [Tessaracoccus sp. G1721]